MHSVNRSCHYFAYYLLFIHIWITHIRTIYQTCNSRLDFFFLLPKTVFLKEWGPHTPEWDEALIKTQIFASLLILTKLAVGGGLGTWGVGLSSLLLKAQQVIVIPMSLPACPINNRLIDSYFIMSGRNVWHFPVHSTSFLLQVRKLSLREI